ncbi:Guanylate-binding protein 1 [Anabarilius grahami]|uniref:Guanylate-binding protein 1 n=1 Tax=Anabarilius grahami TaxID=495550 RepID=A0A3N0XTB4_ANAGA|nr:Guanylate-binding protein 1 [Anabarilius grahami]
MSAPVCLIENDTNEKLRVRKEAKDILDGIKEPVVVVSVVSVVSVVGLYRTGKSYIMNRLAGQQSGFALGSTIESKTKGIWMWCVPHPTKEGHTLVLLDTEGLGDVKKVRTKTIQHPDAECSYVTELTGNIRVKAKVSPDEKSPDFMRIFPSFVWAVRDFTLELKMGNKPITSDEYLESALTLKPGELELTLNIHSTYNTQYFTYFKVAQLRLSGITCPAAVCVISLRCEKCFVFPRPASTQNMRRMEELEENDLDSEFLEQANTFCHYIYDNADPKTVSGGHTITGTALGNLAEVYIEAIRSGKVPCLENPVVSLAKIQNARAVEQALESYMNKMLSMAHLPMDPEDLSNIHTVAEKKATKVITMSFNDIDQIYQQELMGKIYNEYQQMCQQNQEESVIQCKAVLDNVFDKLDIYWIIPETWRIPTVQRHAQTSG